MIAPPPRRLAITAGEPAGVGPDLCIHLAQQPRPAGQVVIADPALLEQRAALLGLPLRIKTFVPDSPPVDESDDAPGELTVWPVSCNCNVLCGQPDPENAAYVLETLNVAVRGCRGGLFDAMVTAPVHKGIINDAGFPFSGHTEYLQALSGADHVVMMLTTAGLRVALVTTHMPLRDVPRAITTTAVEQTLRIVHEQLRHSFAITDPRLLVCGLNPHAGEGGHLGNEDEQIIVPVLERLRREDMQLLGPLPADTVFIPKYLEHADAVVAMYHDQGLPVLKYRGFGNAVNITLGLPFIRTSVDHGTAVDLAGSGEADAGSLHAAIATAQEMIANQRRQS
jgi:4-hydroxythreonine-4-phosphate dehydrogenase